MKKKQTKKPEIIVDKVGSGKITGYEITPLIKTGSGRQYGDDTYQVDVIKPSRSTNNIYLSSKQHYNDNGTKKGAPSQIQMHKSLSDVGKRYPRITPAFKRLK